MSFWCITTFFNPAGYKTSVENHKLFAENLRKQGANLLSIEVAFGDDPFYLPEGTIKVRSKDVMWAKERLINYATSLLPDDCDAFAWIDADLLFGDDNWIQITSKKLDKADIVQLFKRVFYLPRGHHSFQGKAMMGFQGIVAQYATHKDWLNGRRDKDISFAAPGFAWAARRNTFKHVNGLYDKDVVGSGDCILADSLFDSWDLHGYEKKFHARMKQNIQSWRAEFNNKRLSVDYVPIDIFHLWHGDLRNRRYMQRHKILRDHDYDPDKDISLTGPMFEWATNKNAMHKEVRDYFYTRLEDTE